MRLLRAFSFGTERYPRKVARRLRLLNLACWSTAAVPLTFAALFYPDVKLRAVVAIDTVTGIVLLALPLLHRVGPRAAAIAFVAVSYSAIFVICFLVGTGSGMQMAYLAYAAGAVLVFGVDRVTPIVVGLFALLFIVALQVLAPVDGGLLSEAAMLSRFIINATASVTIIFAIVFLAIREAGRAEAIAEFEYERSEALLTNVLPAAIAERLKSQTG